MVGAGLNEPQLVEASGAVVRDDRPSADRIAVHREHVPQTEREDRVFAAEHSGRLEVHTVEAVPEQLPLRAVDVLGTEADATRPVTARSRRISVPDAEVKETVAHRERRSVVVGLRPSSRVLGRQISDQALGRTRDGPVQPRAEQREALIAAHPLVRGEIQRRFGRPPRMQNEVKEAARLGEIELQDGRVGQRAALGRRQHANPAGHMLCVEYGAVRGDGEIGDERGRRQTFGGHVSAEIRPVWMTPLTRLNFGPREEGEREDADCRERQRRSGEPHQSPAAAASGTVVLIRHARVHPSAS